MSSCQSALQRKITNFDEVGMLLENAVIIAGCKNRQFVLRDLLLHIVIYEL